MHVHTYIPPPGHPLAPYIQSIWRVQARGAYSTETILPKGNVDMLFNLSDTINVRWSADGDPEGMQGGAYLAGMQTRAITSLPQGEVLLLGISFRAEVSASVLPVPLHELTDQTLDGTLVLKDVEGLRQRLGELREFDAQAALLIDWLMRRIASATEVAIIDHACAWLRQAPADAGIAELARSLGYSPRHLRRIFLQHIGVTPGHYLRLSRFIRSLHLMSSPLSLTEIAHETNYFDQAHFCRDFREIAGITPGEYRDKVGPAPGHIFTL